MDIFIKWGKNEKEWIKLPVLPASYSIDGKQQNTSVNVHALGEINLKGKRALMTVAWSCFFPGQSYYFAKDSYKNPIKNYVIKFETLMENNTTIHVIIGNRVNMFGTIEKFAWSESEGNGDISYDITIKEFREPGDKTRIKKSFTEYSVEYKWKKGDTWKKVCKKNLMGDATLADKNRTANKKTIDKAIKAYKKKKKIKKTKTVKEETALVGYKVVLKL